MEQNEVMTDQTFEQLGEDLGLDDIFSDADTRETSGEPEQESDQQQAGEVNPQEEAQTTEEDAGQTSEQPEVVNAKFLGKEIPIPKQALESVCKALGVEAPEAVTMLQKGMNYDRVLQATQREMGILDDYARMAGMSRPDFIAHLAQQQKQMQVQAQMQALRKQHPDADENLLRQTAQTNVALQEHIQKEAFARRQMEQKQLQNRQWVDFFKARPDITDVKAIPQEVMQAVSMGESPQSAYLRWENSQLHTQLAQLKQQQKNKETAPPSAISTGAPQQADEFAQGFDAVFK